MDKIEELRYLIKAVDQEGENNYRRMLAPLDITPNQNEVLKILSKKDGLSISEIGDLLICGSDSPSRVIQRLLLKGAVSKENDSSDARKSIIFITDKGLNLLKEAKKIENQFNLQIKKSVESKMNIDQLIDMLEAQVQGTKSLNQIISKKKIDSNL
ncbi:hypothetical protein ATZ33_08245 [Enterococcus silesiacus]|uniref:HTH marR-type domain-containing protein n=1 Tax=Enterococcus silesiacus TaxID=332949 RepID=A0A0S3KAS5_9ENTE|nr:MarR family winged helix-turn-helix transcriptional regulator [Enterococcus silesiacus]ALS01356.1 hypothetical protein ATZ33_08245 [Enterococcus silesiacus]OJG88597.1 hypothetical protein RV15_GL001782 [Enterococcus silesiacus]